MRHIGLFAGIGGFELAARWMGWNTIAWSEWDPFCQKILSYHFPEAKGYGDIKQADFTQYRGQCDILTGGFPCQPYSTAGKRLGKEDERHLWPEMLRVIREVRPRWIIGENVRGLLSWNGGVVFEEVCSDLESEGYEVQAFIIPAASVGAPHRRDRIWFVANASDCRCGRRSCEQCANGRHELLSRECAGREMGREASGCSGERLTTNAPSERFCDERDPSQLFTPTHRTRDGMGCQKNVFNASSIGRSALNNEYGNTQQVQSERKFGATNSTRNAWDGFPAQSPVCGGDDGLPSELDGITLPKWRKESIKAYGNAIVPQVAYQLFQAIKNTKSLAY